MYFSDLSNHPEYSMWGTLAVGWLDKKHVFSTGETSEEFQERLFEFCYAKFMVTRGYHACDLCTLSTNVQYKIQRGDHETWLGSSEIRVVHNEKIYGTPDLIYHYVTVHNYKPPSEFIVAVLQGPLPGTKDYARIKEKFWPQMKWFQSPQQ